MHFKDVTFEFKYVESFYKYFVFFKNYSSMKKKNHSEKVTLKSLYSLDLVYYQNYLNAVSFVFLHKETHLKLFEF